MAWNEPGGEKRNPWNRPQQSQNDLDDVLRNFQRRLSALFGRGGGGAVGGAGPSSANFGKSLSSILVLIGAVWIGSGLYRVDAQERAVVLRFGKFLQTTGPGYNWHLPWPIERKVIVNVSHQYSVVDDASMLTADTNLVEVKSAVQYIQPDALKLLFKVRDVEDTLTQVSESAMREAVGQASLDKAYESALDNKQAEVAGVLKKAGANDPAPSVTVDAAVLASYAGTYKSDQLPLEVKVSAREGKLFLQAVGQPELATKTLSATRFAYAAAQIEVEFDAPDSFTLKQGGGTFKFKKGAAK